MVTLLYEVGAIIHAFNFVAYTAGFATPDWLVNRNTTGESTRFGLWQICSNTGCRSIFQDERYTKDDLGMWFYGVQGLSTGGYALGCLTTIFILIRLACLRARTPALVKAVIISLIPSSLIQGGALGLFLWKICTTLPITFSGTFHFGFSTYLISTYLIFSLASCILLIMQQRRTQNPTDENYGRIN